MIFLERNSMYILSPSILSADFGHLRSELDAIKSAGAQYVHIDVMDGVFVPQISFGMPVIRSIRKDSDLFFDVHLMIVDPIRYIHEFASCGADGITFHLEAAQDPSAVINAIHAEGKKAGLSIKPGTPVEAVIPYLGKIDILLIMTVEPGFGGQKYLPSSDERIGKAAQLLRGAGSHADLMVDGGICKETIGQALRAGANVIVAGSAVFRGDTQANAEYYMDILRRKEAEERKL